MADESSSDTTPEKASGASDSSGTTVALGTTAGVATLFLLLRLFAVSGWDWETAAAIAETIDFDDALPIVLGTLFAEPALTGTLLAVLVPMTLINLLWPPAIPRTRKLSRLLFPMAVLVAAVTWLLTFREAWFFVVAVVVAALIIGVRLIWRRGVGHELVVNLFHRVGTVSICVLLVMAVAVETPWMSHERVHTGESSVSGYIIEDEPGFVKVLTEDREVTIIDTSDVTGRELLD